MRRAPRSAYKLCVIVVIFSHQLNPEHRFCIVDAVCAISLSLSFFLVARTPIRLYNDTWLMTIPYNVFIYFIQYVSSNRRVHRASTSPMIYVCIVLRAGFRWPRSWPSHVCVCTDEDKVNSHLSTNRIKLNVDACARTTNKCTRILACWLLLWLWLGGMAVQCR